MDGRNVSGTVFNHDELRVFNTPVVLNQLRQRVRVIFIIIFMQRSNV